MAKGKQLQPIEANTLDEALKRQQDAQKALDDAHRTQQQATALLDDARRQQTEAVEALRDAERYEQALAHQQRDVAWQLDTMVRTKRRVEVVNASLEMLELQRSHHRHNSDIEISQWKGKPGRVRWKKTTAEKLVDSGHLPAELKIKLEAFAAIVADAVDESGEASSRLIRNAGGVQAGSRSTFQPQRIADARRYLREVALLIPPELRELFVQLVGEEIGRVMEKPMTLGQLGQARGYQHKQASASGGTQAFDVIAMIAHFAQLKGMFSQEFLVVVRQNAALGQKNGENQPLLTMRSGVEQSARRA